MLQNMRLLKYLSSFSEGRVRLRHPAIKKAKVAALVQEKFSAVAGVQSVECNPVSGSLLVLYDSAQLSRDRLIEIGTAWAEYLDCVQAGKAADIPEC